MENNDGGASLEKKPTMRSVISFKKKVTRHNSVDGGEAAAIEATADSEDVSKLPPLVVPDYKKPREVENFEVLARQRIEANLIARLIKIRIAAIVDAHYTEHLRSLSAKQSLLMQAYEPIERSGIRFSYEQQCVALEAYITLARIVDESRRHILADDLFFLSRFHAAVAFAKQQRRLENDEISEREELMHEFYDYMFWYEVECDSTTSQRTAFEKRRGEDNVMDLFAVEGLEGKARDAQYSNEVSFRQEITVLQILQLLSAEYQRELEQAQSDLTAFFGRFIGPFLRLSRVFTSYEHRLLVAKLYAEDAPRRRQERAVCVLHSVVKGYFTRSLFFISHEVERRQRLIAVRRIQRVGRGYVRRLWVVSAILHRILLDKELFQLRLSRTLEGEREQRRAIEEEAAEPYPSAATACSSGLAPCAVATLHRITASYVSRKDLFYWWRHGPQPLDNTSTSAGYRNLGKALDWHSIAARHHLWSGFLCDWHL